MRKSIVLLGVSALLAVASFALDVPANKLVDATWLKKNIADCNTGHLAAGVWVAGRYLVGMKDMRDYKGSMVEYATAEPARKVVK